MPEGDTIHRSAATLRRALEGRVLTRVELPRRPPPLPRVGASVERVEARGKHLLISTSDGLVVHTHQRMTGSWHIYGAGERWRKSTAAVRVVLATEGVVAVCFSSPVVEVLDSRAVRRHPSLRALGPDLCHPDPDLVEATTRLARLADEEQTVGDALLDQRIACGVGNVYRCEVLFLHGLHPDTPIVAVDPATRHRLLDTASGLLRANLRGPSRTTVGNRGSGQLWVHGRGGEPCRRCGSPIRVERRGLRARFAYWCPACQPEPSNVRVASTTAVTAH